VGDRNKSTIKDMIEICDKHAHVRKCKKRNYVLDARNSVPGIRLNPGAKLAEIVEATNVHKNFHFDLLTSSLMRGIHMGEISKMGWLIRLVEHTM
jgi:hypothetical protein